MTTIIAERAVARLAEIALHIQAMEFERVYEGTEALKEVDATRRSFVNALPRLLTSAEVWADSTTDLSLGGILPSGIQYGLIGKPQESKFRHKPIKWTFNS